MSFEFRYILWELDISFFLSFGFFSLKRYCAFAICWFTSISQMQKQTFFFFILILEHERPWIVVVGEFWIGLWQRSPPNCCHTKRMEEKAPGIWFGDDGSEGIKKRCNGHRRKVEHHWTFVYRKQFLVFSLGTVEGTEEPF